MRNDKWKGQDRFYRSPEGLLTGVCQGLAESFGVEAWLIRLGWIASVLFFGVGILFYILAALSLPRKDELSRAHESRFLGVCSRISRRTDIDVGLVRFICAVLAVSSFGATMVGYFVLYFLLPDNQLPERVVKN